MGRGLECIGVVQETNHVQEMGRILARTGVKLTLSRPGSLQALRVRAQVGAFVATYIPDVDAWSGGLSNLFELKHLTFPPLCVVVDKSPSPSGCDRLRQAGAAAILTRPLEEEQLVSVMRQISAARSWMSGRLEHTDLADVLQIVGKTSDELLVVIQPNGGEEITADPWQKNDVGLPGRIYVSEGRVLHVETPEARGMEGLSLLLAQKEGSFRVHQLAISPTERNLDLSVFDALVAAAVHSDHVSSGRPLPNDMPGSKPSSAKPKSPPLSNKENVVPDVDLGRPDLEQKTDRVHFGANRMSDNQTRDIQTLWQQLRTQIDGLKGCARADNSGTLLEFDGQLDAETICAVAAMGRPNVEAIGQALGLGDLNGWSLSNARSTLYVKAGVNGLRVVSGSPDQNPEAKLQRINQVIRDVL